MTPRKVIPATPPPEKDKSIFLKVILTGFLALLSWFAYFVWNLNSTLAVMQNNERYREEKVKTIDENVSTLVNELRSFKDRDIQDMKDRLKTLELEKAKK